MRTETLEVPANTVRERGQNHYFSRLVGTRPVEKSRPTRKSTAGVPEPGQLSDREIDTCEPQVLAAQTGKIRLNALSKGHYPGKTIPTDTLPGLNSIGFWDGTGLQNWGLNAHRNEGVEIHFVETGNMAFLVDGHRFDLHPGDLTITKPWQLHKLGDPHVGPGRVHWLIIDVGVKSGSDRWNWPDWVMLTPADLAELTHRLRQNKMPVCRSSPEIGRIFQQIAKCVEQWGTAHSVSRMIAHLNHLLVTLLDMPVTRLVDKAPHEDPNRHTVELFLNNLAADPEKCRDIETLREMAESCGMGVTSFAKHTREVVNVGPMQFLKQCRLNHAAQQLRKQPGASITEICFSNGFNSSQYFATCFRRQFKMSPREFVSQQS